MWGRALALASPRFDEHAFVFLELLRMNKISGKRLVPGSSTPTASEASHPAQDEIALLSRVLSLMPFQTKERPYMGVVDFDLMAFNSIIHTVYKTLRNLLEMLMLNAFLSRRSEIPADEYTRVSHKYEVQPSNLKYSSIQLTFSHPNQTDYLSSKKIAQCSAY